MSAQQSERTVTHGEESQGNEPLRNHSVSPQSELPEVGGMRGKMRLRSEGQSSACVQVRHLVDQDWLGSPQTALDLREKITNHMKELIAAFEKWLYTVTCHHVEETNT